MSGAQIEMLGCFVRQSSFSNSPGTADAIAKILLSKTDHTYIPTVFNITEAVVLPSTKIIQRKEFRRYISAYKSEIFFYGQRIFTQQNTSNKILFSKIDVESMSYFSFSHINESVNHEEYEVKKAIEIFGFPIKARPTVTTIKNNSGKTHHVTYIGILCAFLYGGKK